MGGYIFASAMSLFSATALPIVLNTVLQAIELRDTRKNKQNLDEENRKIAEEIKMQTVCNFGIASVIILSFFVVLLFSLLYCALFDII